MQISILILLLWIEPAFSEPCILTDSTTYRESFDAHMAKAISNQDSCASFIFSNITGSLDESVLSLLPDETTELQITRSTIAHADVCSPPNLRKLTIANNTQFPVLDENIMRHCEDLSVLEITNASLHISAFARTKALQVLNLQDIVIDHFTLQYIQPLEDLAFLRLANCYVGTIDSEVLCPLTLRRLNLISNEMFPRLTIKLFDTCFSLESLVIVGDSYQMDDDAFNTMARLMKLYIVQTKIERLTKNYFRALFNLRLLHLSDNDIKVVDADAFLNLQNLEMLNLRYSEIELVKPDTFQSLPRLEVLDLTGNRLKKLDNIGEIASLKKLDVSWNLVGRVEVEELKGNFTGLTQFVIYGSGMNCADKKKLVVDVEAQMGIRADCIWGDPYEGC